MTSLFCCPLCGEPLEREPGRLFCPRGHSFDVARQGYVNLLPAGRARSAVPGDSPEMMRARRAFLGAGYYDFLAEGIGDALADLLPDGAVLLDAGCGEGHYDALVHENFRRRGKCLSLCGVDLSKTAAAMAARTLPEGEFAVASVYHLPLAGESVHGVMNVFSPLSAEENARVLRRGGIFLYVVPAARHLYEMKEILYDEPYENTERETPYPGFVYRDILRLEKTLDLDGAALRDLFGMTPYFWTSPREGAERLARCEGLRVTAAFNVHVFERCEDPA